MGPGMLHARLHACRVVPDLPARTPPVQTETAIGLLYVPNPQHRTPTGHPGQIGYPATPSLQYDIPNVAIWIDNPAELTRRHANAPDRIGLDTEFIRERTFWPQLALVQMAVGDEILLIDPLVPGMPEALRLWLEDTRITKIMHSASEDLVAFSHTCGALPRPLFDTQIAAALSGIGGGMGYQKLVAHVTGVNLEKGEQRSDWLRRPLSESQLHYAAADVIHLFALHDHLMEKLTALGRTHWHDQDAQRLVESVANDGVEQWPQLSARAAQFLDAGAQVRLCRLFRWRDAQARQSDKPRSWILDNELATLLAKHPPASLADMETLFERQPKSPKKLSAAIWQALTTPMDDEADFPVAVDNTEQMRAPLKRLQKAVADRSAELGLPDGLLASRKVLEAWIEAGKPPAGLTAWRRVELENRLQDLL